MDRHVKPLAWTVVVTGMLIAMVSIVFGRLAFGLILPFMRADLGLGYGQAGNLVMASSLGYLGLVMVAGMFAARHGGRAAIALGLCLAVAGFSGLGLSSAYPLLLMWMALLGFGTAFAYTPAVSLLAGWYPERRGAIIGFLNSGVGIGMLISGTCIPYVAKTIEPHGWRLVWGIFAIAALAGIGATAFFLRPPPGSGNARAAAQPPLEKAAVYGNPHVVTVGLLYGVTGITYLVQAIFMYSFTLDAGIPPVAAGRLVAVSAAISVFSGPVSGWMSDRLDRSLVLLSSCVATLIAFLIPVFWPSYAGFATHYLIIGCTLPAMFISVLALSTDKVDARHAPLAVSYVTLFFAIGQVIGPGAIGMVIERTGEFKTAFLLTSMVLALGICLSWKLAGFRPRVQA
ncbi:MAG: MFS transporter [Noviherbaspirillum sp.]